MSSEMTFKVIPVVGNTHTWAKGLWVLGGSGQAMCIQTLSWKTAMDSRDEGRGKLCNYGVYVSLHLSLRLYRKACTQKMT
jgi:hypothetical protein